MKNLTKSDDGRNQLLEVFERIQSADWKSPIFSHCKESEMPLVRTAVQYFTGTETQFTKTVIKKDNEPVYIVESIGYRAGPAGDH